MADATTEQIMRTLPFPMLALGRDFHVIWANAAFFGTFQISAAETLGTSVLALPRLSCDTDKLRELLVSITEHQESNAEIDLEIPSPLRGRRIFRLGAYRMHGSESILLTIRDHTEEHDARSTLEESEEQLRSILEAASDAIVSIDRTGRIIWINPATETMFGYTSQELLGRNVNLLMPSPYREQHTQYIERYLTTHEPRIIGIGRELLAQRKNGQTFPVGLKVNVVDHKELFIGIIRDISRKKELENEVVNAAADEQRRIGQDLHDGVGQELTGLRYIAQTHLESLAKRNSPEIPIAERICNGLSTIQRQFRAIIRELVPVELDQQGLSTALRELARRTSETHNLNCEFIGKHQQLIPDLSVATHLYRIAQEAVNNAVRHAQGTHISISLASDEDSLILRVQDNGIGIDENREQSVGIGLRTMSYRAGLMNAKLDITSNHQDGTIITCTMLNMT